MAQQPVTSDCETGREQQLLDRLLRLYAAESRIYREVLSLSRRQYDFVSEGKGIQEMQQVLAQKKNHLDDIARLEQVDQSARDAWRDNRDRWSSSASARLHQALQEVGSLIEEILVCEEENDRLLLKMTGLI